MRQRNIPLSEFFTLQKLRKGDIPLFIAVIELRLAEASKLRSVLSANSKNAGRQGAKVKEDQTEDKTEAGKPPLH